MTQRWPACGFAVLASLTCSSSGSEKTPVSTVAVARDAAGTSASSSDAAPAEPTTLNERIVLLTGSYTTGGGYAWPSPKGTQGTRNDLFAGDQKIATGTRGPTHCSGITFEVFWRALSDASAAPTITAADARNMMREWYVPVDGGMGPAAALEQHSLGRRIPRLEDARPGDFVQVWFNNGRGHTAVFLGWKRDAAGRIAGIRYWSSHPRTDGIGADEREIGARPGDIDRSKIYIGRAAL